MPTLAESYPAMAATLAERYGQGTSAPEESGTFRAVLAAHLGRTLGPEKVGKALEALLEAGLAAPDELAGADLAEVAEAIRRAGVNLPPRGLRPLQRLAG